MSNQMPVNYNSPYPEWKGNYLPPEYAQPYGNGPQAPYPPLPPQMAYPPVAPYPEFAPLALSPERGRGMALAGFILSILSLVTFAGLFAGASNITEFLIWLAALSLSIAGIVLSAVGRRCVSRKALAIVGLVLSILALVLVVAILVVGILVSVHPV